MRRGSLWLNLGLHRLPSAAQAFPAAYLFLLLIKLVFDLAPLATVCADKLAVRKQRQVDCGADALQSDTQFLQCLGALLHREAIPLPTVQDR